MNETGNLPRSVTEGLPAGHALASLIPGLIAARVRDGAHTALGRRYSMLIGQIQNGVSPLHTLREIEQIQQDGGEYIHSHHGAAR